MDTAMVVAAIGATTAGVYAGDPADLVGVPATANTTQEQKDTAMVDQPAACAGVTPATTADDNKAVDGTV